MDRRAKKLNQIFDNVVELEPREQSDYLRHERTTIQKEVRDLLAADAVARAAEHMAAASGESKETLSILGRQERGDEPDDEATIATGSLAARESARDLDVARGDERGQPRGQQLVPHRPPAAVIACGTKIAHLEVIRQLGRGGMGEVFLARDTKLGRKVAIKFLKGAANPAMLRRFVLEARATARCTHENIVVIHDVNQHAGTPYMVLEYLRGKPLSGLLTDGRLPTNRAVELVIPVVRALVRAHQLDIVHRDLKPENIFLTETGTIKVLDFGIAKLVRDPSADIDALMADRRSVETSIRGPHDMTGHGAIVGTMAYMSPEQWRGQGVDHRTDIWAVGLLLYRMIVGKHPLAPLRGVQLAVTRDLERPMPSARSAGVPDHLADVIDRCLRKRKEQRYASAGELLEALEDVQPRRYGDELKASESPYAGLTAFQESDADRFFGRSGEIASFTAWIHDAPIICVTGPSGVGKSSFVRAGGIPALKRSGEQWEAIVVRPGRHPLAALANIVAPMLTGDSSTLSDRIAEHQAALARLYREPGYLGTVLRTRARDYNRKIVLFVDQFEELYTLIPDKNERTVFTACLSGMADDATSPLRVVLALRSDFLDRVAEDHRFMAEMSRGLFFLTPPGREGLRDALVQPAEMMRYRFETPSVVESMLDALERTSGSLPLLQFTAAKLWDMRDTRRRLLTEQSYRAMGGMEGALSSHADAVLSVMAMASQQLVRTIFLRLVTTERTRAIASVNELRELSHEPDAVERLVGQLVDARLLVVQRGDAAMGASVEIVHESLIHSWPTLARWLDESQEDVAFLEQLRQAARQWDDKDRPTGLLWRGEAMEEARRWHARYRGKLASLQERFLQEVFALGTRTARRKRLMVISVMTLLAAIAIAAVIALVVIREAKTQATRQATIARAAEQIANEKAEELRLALNRAQLAERERKAAEEEAKKSTGRASKSEAAAKHARAESKIADAARAKAQRQAKAAKAAARAEQQRKEKAEAKAAQANKELERATRKKKILKKQRAPEPVDTENW